MTPRPQRPDQDTKHTVQWTSRILETAGLSFLRFTMTLTTVSVPSPFQPCNVKKKGAVRLHKHRYVLPFASSRPHSKYEGLMLFPFNLLEVVLKLVHVRNQHLKGGQPSSHLIVEVGIKDYGLVNNICLCEVVDERVAKHRRRTCEREVETNRQNVNA